MDARIINEVRNRTGKIIDVQGGYPHGTAYEKSQQAWPALQSLPAPKDADRDGMPDDWELANKLNPSDATDSALYSSATLFTNIEVYLNSLLKN